MQRGTVQQQALGEAGTAQQKQIQNKLPAGLRDLAQAGETSASGLLPHCCRPAPHPYVKED